MREPELVKKEIKENNISYIYAPKQSNFKPNIEVVGLEKIFDNSDVEIYKVAKE